MDISGDLSSLLADFGVTVTVGMSSFLAIFNEPEQIVGDLAVTSDYSILAKTSDVSALAYNAALTIGASTYNVRRNIKQDDGLLSLVTLTKA